MPYKIYTYTDPYRIYKTDFWDEIKDYPQLCASRTLVNGLTSVMEDELASLVCQIDDIVKDRIFRNWTGDIGLRIRQYSELCRSCRTLKQKVLLSDNELNAVLHNSEGMLDSIRLFIELGIKSGSLKTKGMLPEHRLFHALLDKLESSESFKLPIMPSLDTLRSLLSEQAEKEKEEKERLHAENAMAADDDGFWKKDQQFISRMIQSTEHWDGKHIVIHGIHQFTPLQLRFIEHLEKNLHMEVIFVYNFLPEFREIYSSWSYIYQQFNAASIHADENIKNYDPAWTLPGSGNALAANIGLMCQGVSWNDRRIRDNYNLYKDFTVQEFDSVSEFAGYVSDEFQKAEELADKDSERSGNIIERSGTSAVLRRMCEVVYTANQDVDALLQVYHPEYARNRHFLDYPVGQFFYGLYSMWDPETQSLALDYRLLTECVNSGMLSGYRSETLLKTLINLQPLFERISKMQDFKEIAGVKYRDACRKVHDTKKNDTESRLKTMNIYSTYKVTDDDFNSLYSAILEIDQIAGEIFVDTGKESFSFRKHFERLSKFVRGRQSELLSSEEKVLISELLEKLNLITQPGPDTEGTFEDLRKGLYYFLKQKDEPDVDRFVKGFEQIDGDILCSWSQNKLGSSKTYHFACISDADMNSSTDDLLPWPLSERFIRQACGITGLPFHIYHAALGERSNFLRYELFYGLYFNQCKSKLSFVKHCGNKTTDMYSLLRFLGLRTSVGDATSKEKTRSSSLADTKDSLPKLTYKKFQMADMFLCPYRYFLDYVMNREPVISGAFMFRKLYENLLIKGVWKDLQIKGEWKEEKQGYQLENIDEELQSAIDTEAQSLSFYFPFLMETEILDIVEKAKNYLSSDQVIDTDNNIVRPYNEVHMLVREQFGSAKFTDDSKALPEHPLPEFDELTKDQDKPNAPRSYLLSRIFNTKEQPELKKAALGYLQKDENLPNPGKWCSYCPNRGICLSPFSEEENEDA